MQITLYHNYNFASFKLCFPDAIFLGFEYGFHKPSFSVNDKEWKVNKHMLPKSCEVVKIIKDNHKLTQLRAQRARKKYSFTDFHDRKRRLNDETRARVHNRKSE